MADESVIRCRWTEERLDGLQLLRGRSTGLEVALLPEVGGKIISLRSATGREWLWQTRRPYRRPVYGCAGWLAHPRGVHRDLRCTVVRMVSSA
jgi:hypothetical protein